MVEHSVFFQRPGRRMSYNYKEWKGACRGCSGQGGLRRGRVTLRCHAQSETILCSVRGVELGVEMGHTMRLNLGILQSFPG